MRKSQAPSQRGFKRPRFINEQTKAPIAPNDVLRTVKADNEENKGKEQSITCEYTGAPIGKTRGKSNKTFKSLHSVKASCATNPIFEATKELEPSDKTEERSPRPSIEGAVTKRTHEQNYMTVEPFKLKEKVCLKNNVPSKTSMFRLSMVRPKPSTTTPPLSDTTNEENTPKRYFKVMWCKLSNKKHKKWEDDAVMVVSGRSVVLNDMEGRCLGKSGGFKLRELESLKEGETLRLGGKEVEIMCTISSTDYESGQCYLQSASTQSAIDSIPTFSNGIKSINNKPFKPVAQKGTYEATTNLVPQPRYDPNGVGAIVLPRPSLLHQRRFNPKGRPVVDVVIDPYIACHLRSHQVEGVRFLYECTTGMRDANHGLGAILADERQNPYYGMGPVVRRAVVVCPGSLVKNWDKEFSKWLGIERIRVCAVSGDKRVEDFCSSQLYQVAILSYEMFRQSVHELNDAKIDLIICDEGHRIKNGNIKTTKSIFNLATTRRIILTGTPIQNHLQEFYNMCEFVMPGILGSLSTFNKVFESAIIAGQHPNSTTEEKLLAEKRACELQRLTAIFVLRRTQEINYQYLPPKVEQVVFCRPEAIQLDIYKKILQSKLARAVLETSVKGPPQLMCIMALKKVCNDPYLLAGAQSVDKPEEEGEDSGYLMQILQDDADLKILLERVARNKDNGSNMDSGKLRVVKEMIAQIYNQGEKVVLVSHSTQTLDILQIMAKAMQWPYCRLDGSTPLAKRQNIVDLFNMFKSTSSFLFLLSSKAGGMGLNLVGASHLILYDIDWNPANDLQAMARIWRDGQRNTAHIYRLLTTGTIEEKIFQRQIAKQSLSGAVVQSQVGTLHFSQEQLKNLFAVPSHTDCNTHDLLKCTCCEEKSNDEQDNKTQVDDIEPMVGCDLDEADRLLDDINEEAEERREDMSYKEKNFGIDALMDWSHYKDTTQCP
eukprot:Ihof_evm2s247 gene=Ihof_evmTU2s247